MGKPRLNRPDRLAKRETARQASQGRVDRLAYLAGLEAIRGAHAARVSSNLHSPPAEAPRRVVRDRFGSLQVIAARDETHWSEARLKGATHIGFRENRPAKPGPAGVAHTQRWAGSRTCDIPNHGDARPVIGSSKS